MFDENNTGKLLLFPAPAPVPGSSTEQWVRRILEARDNLVSALEFLRITYNESLAGRPIKPADEIMASVDAILKHDKIIPAYTVVGAIRIHRPASGSAKRKALLVFPQETSKV